MLAAIEGAILQNQDLGSLVKYKLNDNEKAEYVEYTEIPKTVSSSKNIQEATNQERAWPIQPGSESEADSGSEALTEKTEVTGETNELP